MHDKTIRIKSFLDRNLNHDKFEYIRVQGLCVLKLTRKRKTDRMRHGVLMVYASFLINSGVLGKKLTHLSVTTTEQNCTGMRTKNFRLERNNLKFKDGAST